MTKILVTGGSGFIAAHILEQLLEKGHTVVTTVRSEEKAQNLRNAHKDKADRLHVAIVPDIAQPNAFDEVAKTPGLEVVMHTASPFHYNWTNPQTELIDPALNGTKSILQAIHASAKTVTRMIITSSFAAIMSEAALTDPSTTFTEQSWNPSVLGDIHNSRPTAYRVSKTLAERAAWDFVAENRPSFDLVTVNPPLVFGPVVHHLATLDSINTSNERFVSLLQGKWKKEIPPTGGVTLWVDVRDTARAHVRAMEVKECGGQRLFATAGEFTNRQVIEAIRKECPEFQDRLPPPELEGGEAPDKTKCFSWNNDVTNKLIGINWISVEQSSVDLAKSLKQHGI